MIATRTIWLAHGLALALAATGLSAAQNTNGPAASSAPPRSSSAAVAKSPATNGAKSTPAPARNAAAASRRDDSAFRIIGERNIFNATRSGGQVRPTSTRRPTRVDSFTLVGTMAYERGAFAFFSGSSSEFTKVVKPAGVIAGHKLVDILADAALLEADGKTVELPVGRTMRREDEGAWHPSDAPAGIAGQTASSGRESSSSDRSDRYGRSGRDDADRVRRSESGADRNSAPASGANQSEILKRLMERREKESQ